MQLKACTLVINCRFIAIKFFAAQPNWGGGGAWLASTFNGRTYVFARAAFKAMVANTSRIIIPIASCKDEVQ